MKTILLISLLLSGCASCQTLFDADLKKYDKDIALVMLDACYSHRRWVTSALVLGLAARSGQSQQQTVNVYR
jgi:uncharacterized protein YceK